MRAAPLVIDAICIQCGALAACWAVADIGLLCDGCKADYAPPMNERELSWYGRGRIDGLMGGAVLQFENPPADWTRADVDEARAAYLAGLDSGIASGDEFRGMLEDIRECEGAAASPEMVDGSRFHEMLAGMRADLVAFMRRTPGGAAALWTKRGGGQ